MGAGPLFHRWLWLVHVLFVYALLFCFPFTKLRHLVFGPLNLFFRNMGPPRGRLAPIKDFENAETFGVSQVEQYNLETTARYVGVPRMRSMPRLIARRSVPGKALNPKYLVIEQREHSAGENAVPARGESAREKWRRHRRAGLGRSRHDHAGRHGRGGLGMHVVRMVRRRMPRRYRAYPADRRYAAVRRADGIALPRPNSPARSRESKNQGNPWGLAQEKRAEWAQGLDIPEIAELEDPSDIDVLYWVGCAGSYDERNQRVSKSFSGLMKQAGVKFAILGREETCNRRSGAATRQTSTSMQPSRRRMSRRSIATSRGESSRNAHTAFTTSQNEYPDFGGNYTVLHEAEFIDELIQAGRLKPRKENHERITYHDPCYMARHNRKWDSARTALGAIPGAEVAEVEQSKNRTFCCGAGGGCFWKEEHEGTRINQKRFDQLSEAKARVRRSRMSVLHDDDGRRG